MSRYLTELLTQERDAALAQRDELQKRIDAALVYVDRITEDVKFGRGNTQIGVDTALVRSALLGGTPGICEVKDIPLADFILGTRARAAEAVCSALDKEFERTSPKNWNPDPKLPVEFLETMVVEAGFKKSLKELIREWREAKK